MNQKVAVIGAGRMGSALAAALYKRGFDTTVWESHFVKDGIFVPARSTRRATRAGSGRQR
jgi:3-hydroxyisobutyrate dehydrogenase-like beta-hydroxyacid dehydrogenase